MVMNFHRFFWRIRKTAKRDYQLRHVCLSVLYNSAPTGRILIEFDIWLFLRNVLEISSFINIWQE